MDSNQDNLYTMHEVIVKKPSRLGRLFGLEPTKAELRAPFEMAGAVEVHNDGEDKMLIRGLSAGEVQQICAVEGYYTFMPE